MIGIIIITVTALIFSIILVNLDSFLNDRIDEITNLLPGYNCRACGYNSCKDLAIAISKDSSLYTKCKFLKGDALVEMEEYLKKTSK